MKLFRFIDTIKLIKMSEGKEERILRELGKIEGLEDYLELQKRAAYELYGKSDDKRYLGYVQFVENFGRLINLTKPQEETRGDQKGYDSMV